MKSITRPNSVETHSLFQTKDHRSCLIELVHADVCSSYHGESITHTPFMLSLVNDHSRCTWTFLLSSKHEVNKVIGDFIKMVHTQFKKSILKFMRDNGSEFINHAVTDLFVKHRIQHLKSCVYSP